MSEAPLIPLREPVPRHGSARERLFRDVVGDLLRRIRQDQERTLRDVAGRAQVSVPYLSEVERGRKEASSEVLLALCRSLGIEMGDLIMATGRELMAEAVRSALDVTSRQDSVRPSANGVTARSVTSPPARAMAGSALALAA